MPNKGRSQKEMDFFGLTDSRASREFVVVGIPWDRTSSYRRGAAAGPDAIRKATSANLYNRFTEQGADLGRLWKVCDHGNVKATNVPGLKKGLVSVVNRHGHRTASTLFLGGDHFVTFPCFSLMAERHKRRLSLLYFDAHPDLYDRYEGNSSSHATVVSRILDENGLSSGVVCYVGIRASTEEQDEKVRELGMTCFTTRDVYRKGSESIASSLKSVLIDQPVYLSLDLDCLDPAFAPGVGNPQPGGLTVRQVLDILQGIAGTRIVAADIVEYAPRFDSESQTTAFTAAILIKELLGAVAKSA